MIPHDSYLFWHVFVWTDQATESLNGNKGVIITATMDSVQHLSIPFPGLIEHIWSIRYASRLFEINRKVSWIFLETYVILHIAFFFDETLHVSSATADHMVYRWCSIFKFKPHAPLHRLFFFKWTAPYSCTSCLIPHLPTSWPLTALKTHSPKSTSTPALIVLAMLPSAVDYKFYSINLIHLQLIFFAHFIRSFFWNGPSKTLRQTELAVSALMQQTVDSACYLIRRQPGKVD